MTYATHLAHLIRMASIPGFKEHAWHRAKQLDAQYPGISAALTAEMRRLQAAAMCVEPKGQK